MIHPENVKEQFLHYLGDVVSSLYTISPIHPLRHDLESVFKYCLSVGQVKQLVKLQVLQSVKPLSEHKVHCLLSFIY